MVNAIKTSSKVALTLSIICLGSMAHAFGMPLLHKPSKELVNLISICADQVKKIVRHYKEEINTQPNLAFFPHVKAERERLK